MNHGSLFSGIGGFDLAAQWMGWNNLFHCEIDEFNRKVLKYYWPNAKTHTDIKATDFTVYKGQIDILTGGFPCQPYSQAGKRLGKEDDRHLWPEMLRAIREIKPRWIVGENVRGLVNWNGGLVFEEVHTDLETQGYKVQAFILPAASVGAHHKRERIWFCAYSNGNRRKRGENGKYSTRKEWENNTKKQSKGLCKPVSWNREWSKLATRAFPRNDGLSERLGSKTFSKYRRIGCKAAGNAVVPQVVYEIFKAIEAYENQLIN